MPAAGRTMVERLLEGELPFSDIFRYGPRPLMRASKKKSLASTCRHRDVRRVSAARVACVLHLHGEGNTGN